MVRSNPESDSVPSNMPNSVGILSPYQTGSSQMMKFIHRDPESHAFISTKWAPLAGVPPPCSRISSKGDRYEVGVDSPQRQA
ncbi:hypothetical protein E2C01_079038 [Portunus trituberculatus]|uniref:Uncharacterized protein n=1 Tax=Portunus trituberculatus TaxID=210409 RepID=A0A5B7IFX6_PORTR|nr:hypothetical protein [Portunus trituberculatus]